LAAESFVFPLLSHIGITLISRRDLAQIAQELTDLECLIIFMEELIDLTLLSIIGWLLELFCVIYFSLITHDFVILETLNLFFNLWSYL